MSAIRIQKLFQAMPSNIKSLGAYTFDINDVIRWQGRVNGGTEDGKDAVLIDIDAYTWAASNRRAILVATPFMEPNNFQAFKTRSHATGYFIDGGVRMAMYVETPSAVTDAESKFDRLALHHLIGQLGGTVELFYCAHGTEPTVQGVNGAGSTASFTSAGVYVGGTPAVPGNM